MNKKKSLGICVGISLIAFVIFYWIMREDITSSLIGGIITLILAMVFTYPYLKKMKKKKRT